MREDKVPEGSLKSKLPTVSVKPTPWTRSPGFDLSPPVQVASTSRSYGH